MTQNFNLGFFAQNLTINAAANSISVGANGFAYPNGEGVGTTYILDNISSLFDGKITTTFKLSVNNTPVTPSNPNMVNVFIGGVPVTPARYDYVNLPEITAYSSGFKINGSNITFTVPPTIGMSFYGTYRTSQDPAPAFNYSLVPFQPLNIMLGY
jgi:hypothetical protein